MQGLFLTACRMLLGPGPLPRQRMQPNVMAKTMPVAALALEEADRTPHAALPVLIVMKCVSRGASLAAMAQSFV